VLHSLKSGQAKYRGGPQGPKGGPSPIASTAYVYASFSFLSKDMQNPDHPKLDTNITFKQWGDLKNHL